MMRIRPVLAVTIVAFLLPCCFSGSLHAGGLKDFEKAATDQTEQKGDQNKKSDHHKNQSDDCNTSTSGGLQLGDDFWRFWTVFFSQSTRLTMERVKTSGDPELARISLREKGAPDLPFVRTDMNYQRVSSQIKGVDGRVLVGYGPVGAQYRQTQYREEGAADPLNFIQMHGIFRMSWNEAVEFGMGYGNLILDGHDRNSGFSMTYPLSIYPTKHIGLNVTPTWSWINRHAITDCDGSVSYVIKYFSVRAGYRRIKVRDQALSGPYVGLSFHY